jgi:hypothetical protein
MAGADPTTHPAPLPLSTIRPDHPRIWFNSDNLALARQRWADPEYSAIVSKYAGGSGVLSLALEGLMTEDVGKCSQAAANVGSGYSADGSGAAAGWADNISLVFDWCYNYISASERASLVSKIDNLRNEHKNHAGTGIRAFFRWHSDYLFSAFAYLAAVLAIEGEPGVTPELQMAQNMTQNLRDIGDEVSGDGGYRDYWLQGNNQTLPFLMWSYATELDFASISEFTQRLTWWVACKLAPSRNGFLRGPGDDASFEDAFLKDQIDAGGFYMLASHFDDPLAQWIGNVLRDDFGQDEHWWGGDGPMFTSLIHYDPSRTAQSPADLGLSTTALFDKTGMVHARSDWGAGDDVIHSWFYNGPSTVHSSPGQNSFTIWRGDDLLIMRGGNYLGSPSVYEDGYHKESVSHNTVLFSPVGSATPDVDGGQGLGFASAAKFPHTERVGSYSGQARYRGHISHYEDTAEYSITVGDLAGNTGTACYDDNHVDHFTRDFVQLKPDIYLIRDRFVTMNVAAVRSLIHSRDKPTFQGSPIVVEGSESAGILELGAAAFAIQHGGSKAEIEVLWPASPTLRFVGGSGYESYADGQQYDPYADCQSWLKTHWELPRRAGVIEGQWRTEIEVTPAQASGNLIVAIYVSKVNPASSPQYTVTQNGPDFVVEAGDFNVAFPADDIPVVTSISTGKTVSLTATINAATSTGVATLTIGESMAQFDVHIPDSFVSRLTNPVDERVAAVWNFDVVQQKILPWLGVSDQASLTNAQKAELVCQVHLWELESNSHSRNDAAAARNAAVQDSLDSFNPGT